jgi:hypothetical protein
VPQQGLENYLDYREPPRVCRGNRRTWFQKFYQNRGGILLSLLGPMCGGAGLGLPL